jgi:hypothetical protein
MMKKYLLLLAVFVASTLDISAKHEISQTEKDKAYDLNFNSKKYTTEESELNGKTIVYRVYKNIVYVSNPVDKKYQCMNIFIPEAYFKGQTVNDYNKDSAPIFLPNNVGGYMPATPGTVSNDKSQDRPQMGGNRGGGMPPMPGGGGDHNGGMNGGGKGNPGGGMPPMGGQPNGNMPMIPGMMGRQNTILQALARGYVVASPGARGRSLQNKNGTYYGKAPAFVVDLKAAVRYLRYNDKVMPGNAERIISNGTSAGGALSALLGASGNSKDYDSYLKEIGAADANDNIFAVSAYCPITNLDHADAAYEWLFNGVNTYPKRGMGMFNFEKQSKGEVNTLSDKEIDVSNKLKALFTPYVNSLKLTTKDGTQLTLDNEGNGTFKDYVMSFVIASAQKALNGGTDLSKISWLTIENGKVTGMDFNKYVQSIKRQKSPSAFDALDLSTAETIEFGTSSVNAQHFTTFGLENSTVKSTMADAQIIKMMNPMNYIGTTDATPAKHWRIRHGTIDRDGSIAIPIILATKLQNNGYDVDIALPWNTPHSGDYDLTELFNWIDRLCK